MRQKPINNRQSIKTIDWKLIPIDCTVTVLKQEAVIMSLIDGFMYKFTIGNKEVTAKYSDKHHMFSDTKWHIYHEGDVQNIKLIKELL